MIDKEMYSSSRRKAGEMDWMKYWTLDEIYEWLDALVLAHSGVLTPFTIGNSYEGRPIRGVKVSTGGTGKKAIFFESTIHAAEWIATTTSTFFLNTLLTSTDPTLITLFRRFDWYFVPVVNVDGYEYSWKTDRMWRKTRRPTRNILCSGTDPNRNFDITFGQHRSTKNPCDVFYSGEAAFSEPETRQLADYVLSIPDLVGYFSLHSFGQFIMLPWAHKFEPFDHFGELLELAQSGAESLREVSGKIYQVGQTTDFFGEVFLEIRFLG